MNVTLALERLKIAAHEYCASVTGNDESLCKAALLYAAAKRKRANSRDKWKMRKRLGESAST